MQFFVYREFNNFIANRILDYFTERQLKMLFRLLSLVLLLPITASADEFRLQSTDIKHNKLISNKFVLKGFGCNGENISPEISWVNAPVNTKSFAVTAYDPDAPTDSGWWHWVVFNLPATASSLPQGAGNSGTGSLPKGAVQSRTDFGTSGWGGPCPPQGDKPHRFKFTVYALKTEKIDLDENASAAMVSYMLNVNSLSKASIVAKSHRK